jgi:PPOX class probable F420-dependent enzyme
VPVTFAVEQETVFTAVDHKPKRSRDLRRLRNVERDPRVTLLVHHYADDWTTLWWCRLEGDARIAAVGPELDLTARLLQAKYPQYVGRPPQGPAIVISVTDVGGWRA